MNQVEPTGSAIALEALGALPAPIKTSFIKALSNLLGGFTAIPAAKLKQIAQGIEDTTAARSAIAAAIARSAGEAAIADPELLQAAAEIYVPTALRKVQNRARVALSAAEHVSQNTNHTASGIPPEDDWLNYFARFAEDASSEKLQDLFGRILAGQITRPGSFAQRTIRTVGELDQSIAADFSIVWSKSVGEAVDYTPEFQLGDGFSRWMRLVEAGLMAPSDTAQFLPPFNGLPSGNGLWSPMSAGGAHLLVHFPQGCAARWSNIAFTRTGREIGSILARPDFEANIRQAGKRLAMQGVSRVELHVAGKPVEWVA